MNKCSVIILSLVFLIFSACITKNPQISEPNLPYIIDVENLTESIDLKLSDLADTFDLVQLETKEDCLIDNYTKYYVYESYILAYGKKGVYKFSREGKFLKKLFGTGRGPNEFLQLVGFCTFIVDEKNDQLYLYDQIHRSEIFVYDLKSEMFINPIQKLIPGHGDFYIFNDTTIINSIAEFSNKAFYAAYFQNLKGSLISAIPHKNVLIHNKNKIPDIGMLNKSDTNYFFNFMHSDTLFMIKENELIPFIALKFQIPREFPANSTKQIGYRFISYTIQNPKFIKISISTLVNQIWYSQDAGDETFRNTYIYFDITNGRASKIKTYTDDLVNKSQDLQSSSLKDDWYLDFPSVQSNKTVVISYQPLQILEAVQKGLTTANCFKNINAKLKDLSLTLKETDNPILLIGN